MAGGLAGVGEARAWLDAEHENLVAAAHLAASATNNELTALAVELIRVLAAHYLDFTRHFDDWVSLSEDALTAARRDGDRPTEGWALSSLGSALREVGRVEDSVSPLFAAVQLSDDIGEPTGMARSRCNLGQSLGEAGRLTEAVAALRRSADIWNEVGAPVREAIALTNLGAVLGEAGRHEQAVTALVRAAKLAERGGDQRTWHPR